MTNQTPQGAWCYSCVCLYEQNEHRSPLAHFRIRFHPRLIMSPSNNNPKDTSHPRHRSHKGCWTCKRKRIQCDEIRPGCRRCTERGLNCEGYEIRLRWGAGIASRGRFSGADKPIKESIPPPSRRRWDLRAKGEPRYSNDQQGQPVLLLGQDPSRGKGTWTVQYLISK